MVIGYWLLVIGYWLLEVKGYRSKVKGYRSKVKGYKPFFTLCTIHSPPFAGSVNLNVLPTSTVLTAHKSPPCFSIKSLQR